MIEQVNETTPTEVYVVTVGIYDDYRVDKVFLSKEKAEEYISVRKYGDEKYSILKCNISDNDEKLFEYKIKITALYNRLLDTVEIVKEPVPKSTGTDFLGDQSLFYKNYNEICETSNNYPKNSILAFSINRIVSKNNIHEYPDEELIQYCRDKLELIRSMEKDKCDYKKIEAALLKI